MVDIAGELEVLQSPLQRTYNAKSASNEIRISHSTKLLHVSLTYTERHYSYECKIAPQERPYIPRPSRTQQLSNPKLLPKLSTEVPEEFQKKCLLPCHTSSFIETRYTNSYCRKKGLDEEAAKDKPEEARKEGRPERKGISSSHQSPPRSSRRRSPSYDSVSTVSTRSPTPPPMRDAPNPTIRGRARARDLNKPSYPGPDPHRRSVASNEDGYDSQRSVSPVKDRRRRPSRSLSRSVSRSPEPRQQGGDRRTSLPDRRNERRPSPVPRRRDYSESRSRSRSPVRSPTRWEDGKGRKVPAASRYRDREDQYESPRRNAAPPPQREPIAPARARSLSPFSKRLALTQAMNSRSR